MAAAASAGLLALAGLNAFLSARAERRSPPTGRFIEIDGTKIHYEVVGAGPPVVILHGNGSMIADFLSSDFVTSLSKAYSVYLFDRPGYGYSASGLGWWTAGKQARLFDSALKQLGISNEIVLAHSWATLIALSLALRRPVRGLVLLSGYYFPSVRFDVVGAGLPAAPGIGDIWRWTAGPLISRAVVGPAFRLLFSPAPVSERFRALFPVGLAVRPKPLKASSTEAVMMIPTAFTLSRRYASIKVPTVVVAGDGDKIVSPSQAKRLSETMPNASLVTVPGVGHMVHHTSPVEVLAALERVQCNRPAHPNRL